MENEKKVNVQIDAQETLVSTIGEVTKLTLGPTFKNMEGVARGQRK